MKTKGNKKAAEAALMDYDYLLLLLLIGSSAIGRITSREIT